MGKLGFIHDFAVMLVTKARLILIGAEISGILENEHESLTSGFGFKPTETQSE